MSQYTEIKNKAIYFLSRREYSKLELITRLNRYPNFQEDLIIQVIDELIEKDYLSDLRFSEQYVNMLLNKGLGFKKIKYELKLKGISDARIIELLNISDINWHTNALNLAHKKYGKKNIRDVKILAKIQRHLYSKGFDIDIIYYVINYYKNYQDYETT
tara:strand:+ start:8746 stop:9219 length:474 start_codon:yes stop_codon:yes gene_type:complete